MHEEQVVEILVSGGVGVLATDTLYGLVGSAFLPETVERIYTLKHRYPDKPLIVLIHDIDDIERFGVELSEKLTSTITQFWPGPYSIILPCIDEEFEYLTRGTDSIAFRIPDNDDLRELLKHTGPLLAPSANPEGKPPAETVEEARRYFGTSVDFYLDDGEKIGKSSTILKIIDGEIITVRE